MDTQTFKIINQIFDAMKKTNTYHGLFNFDTPYNNEIGDKLLKKYSQGLSMEEMCDYCLDYETIMNDENAFCTFDDKVFSDVSEKEGFLTGYCISLGTMDIIEGCFNSSIDLHESHREDLISSWHEDFRELYKHIKNIISCVPFPNDKFMTGSLVDMKRSIHNVGIILDKLKIEVEWRENCKCLLKIGDKTIGPFICDYIEQMKKDEEEKRRVRLISYGRINNIETMLEYETSSEFRDCFSRCIDINGEKYGPYPGTDIDKMLLDEICIIPKTSEEEEEEEEEEEAKLDLLSHLYVLQ